MPGKVVKIRADVTEYRGSIQLTASNIRMATQEDSYDVSALCLWPPLTGMRPWKRSAV